MSAELAHSVMMHSTKTDSKNVSNVVDVEDLAPLPLPIHALRSISSLESRPVECHNSILEENKDTGSDTRGPVTLTGDSHPHSHVFHVQQDTDSHQNSARDTHTKPLIVSTSLTPPSRPVSSKLISQASQHVSQNSTQARPTLPRTPSRMRSLFRRSDSHSQEEHHNTVLAPPILEARPTSSKSSNLNAGQGKWSMSRSAGTSPKSSVSNTPPSPGSPTRTVSHTMSADLHTNIYLSQDAFDRKTLRASTGLALRSKIGFGTTPRPQRPGAKKRSNSVANVSDHRKSQPDISIPAQAGSGLKARRLSTSLPDDFYVDTCELNDEFTNTSKLPGRKHQCGSGTTATVKVMKRKGDSSGCQYAVKEFRKRSQKEEEREYEKKVKSEFTIAQSLHHKNIVETARLCTHSGRWNHVMEYCQYGDIFALIEQKYLKHEDHLCFFKQLMHGVAYLHEHGIAHRDIKLENLLMNKEGYIKITDFGVSEVFSGVHPGVRGDNGQCGKDMKEFRRCSPGICGSLPYIAPEVLAKNGDYDPRPLDVWSCAIVFLAMWHGGIPWPAAERKHDLYEKFAIGWDKFFAENPDGLVTDMAMPKVGPLFSTLASSGMRRLLLQMLHPDPEKRISIQQAVHDRWFKTIECCCIDDETLKNSVKGIDAAGKQGCKMAAKMVVKKCHHHLPPEKRSTLLQHRFDMGDGWSKYD